MMSDDRRMVIEALRDSFFDSTDEVKAALLHAFGHTRDDAECFDFDYGGMLADLIDDCIDPTCRDIGDVHTFVCSNCGCELDVDDREGEPTMWDGGAPAVPKYCPNCRSRVVRRNED